MKIQTIFKDVRRIVSAAPSNHSAFSRGLSFSSPCLQCKLKSCGQIEDLTLLFLEAEKSQDLWSFCHLIGISWFISSHICGSLPSSSKASIPCSGHWCSLNSLLSSLCVERLALWFFVRKLASCSLPHTWDHLLIHLTIMDFSSCSMNPMKSLS